MKNHSNHSFITSGNVKCLYIQIYLYIYFDQKILFLEYLRYEKHQYFKNLCTLMLVDAYLISKMLLKEERANKNR